MHNRQPTPAGIFRTSRQYAQMAEQELAAENELSIEAADALTGIERPDLAVVRELNVGRQIHVARAGVYARLAQMSAVHEAS